MTAQAPEPDTIWTNTLDAGAWHAEVIGTEPGHGLLRVLDANGVVVHSENVSLAYGAIFGPDVDDVETWKNRVTEVVDNPDKRVVL